MSSEFGLRVVAIDQYNNSTHTDFWVDVDGVRVTVSGPANTWLSNGGSTWTAVGRGGYPPYTVDWYVTPDGSTTSNYVGSGMSYSGYPGQGNVKLEAVLYDSHGRSIDGALMVNGFGDPNDPGGCVPPPGQFICN